MERLTLGRDLSSAATARHWVCDRCPEQHLPAARRWIAELLTSELVANALEHGRGPVLLTLTHDDEGIVVGISDGDARGPSLRQQVPGATEGRGIALVDALATTWGYYPSHAADAAQEATDGPLWPTLTEDGDASRGTDAGGVATAAAPGGKTVWFHLATGR